MKTAPFNALGIDVGGTKIAAGVVSFPDGHLRLQQVIPTAPARGGQAVLDDVARLAEDLAREAEANGHQVRGVGLGLCELVDRTGCIVSTNCIHWDHQHVTERLSRIAPVVIEADVRAAALAEALFGAGRSFRIFLYVTVGTGISSCLMIDREPFVGARGATGTMASSPMSWLCGNCGQVTQRTLEEIASGPALVARFNQRRQAAAKSGLDVLAAANMGDREALDVLRSAAEVLGSTVALLVNVLDPEAVIVGGGLGLSDGFYWESFIDSARRHIWSNIHRDLPILQASSGQVSGIIGAAATVWKRLFLV